MQKPRFRNWSRLLLISLSPIFLILISLLGFNHAYHVWSNDLKPRGPNPQSLMNPAQAQRSSHVSQQLLWQPCWDQCCPHGIGQGATTILWVRPQVTCLHIDCYIVAAKPECVCLRLQDLAALSWRTREARPSSQIPLGSDSIPNATSSVESVGNTVQSEASEIVQGVWSLPCMWHTVQNFTPHRVGPQHHQEWTWSQE